MMSRLSVTVEVLDTTDPQVLTFIGRDAWALTQLYKAGDEGCTPLDTPGPRWSGYVHKLRRAGLEVETIREPHRGPFTWLQDANYALTTSHPESLSDNPCQRRSKTPPEAGAKVHHCGGVESAYLM